MGVKKTLKKIWDKFTSSDRILVTGGLGYIGSHTVVELMEAGYDVYVVDNLSNSNIEVLNGIEAITGKCPVFENIDCTDYVAMDKFFTKYEGFKAVIHFAAYKAVGESVSKPLRYYRNNILSLINVLELMPIHQTEGIVFSSSCTVYGQPDKLPVDEKSPIKDALSPYGYTKQVCERIIMDTVHASEDMNAVILRYFNPIGAHPTASIGELPNGVPNNLVPFVCQTVSGVHKKLSVFGNDYNTPDGTCIRDYINVVDLAKAHVKAIERLFDGKMKKPEIYNIGTGKGASVMEVIKTFEAVSGKRVPYEVVGRREGDIERVWANPALANKKLNWQAETSFEETLLSAWRWQEVVNKRTK